MITMGIDIGGSGIKGALVDCDKGEILSERQRFHTPHKVRPDNMAQLIKQLVLLQKWSGKIGVGFPAVIKNDIAMNAANISKKWMGMDVPEFIRQQTGCPTFAINDADAAGLAEVTFGAGRSFDRGIVLVLTVGTGIGSSIFVNGQMLPNTEFGHLQIRGKDAERRASDYIRKEKNLAWKKWANRFQEFLNEMEKLINPDVIIIGGGVSKYHLDFFDLLSVKAQLLPAKLLNNAGIIGAALFASLQKQ
jgi:polyphosphate glucokinase